jgi:hypothetical protein
MTRPANASRRNEFGPFRRKREREPMLLIAVALTVALVAADLLAITKRDNARRTSRFDAR